MKRLRHRLGRWLLRDEQRPARLHVVYDAAAWSAWLEKVRDEQGSHRVLVVPDARGWSEKLRAQLRDLP